MFAVHKIKKYIVKEYIEHFTQNSNILVYARHMWNVSFIRRIPVCLQCSE